MYNAIAIKKHFVEDAALRPIGREARLGRPSALPTRVRLFISMPSVVESTLYRLESV